MNKKAVYIFLVAVVLVTTATLFSAHSAPRQGSSRHKEDKPEHVFYIKLFGGEPQDVKIAGGKLAVPDAGMSFSMERDKKWRGTILEPHHIHSNEVANLELKLVTYSPTVTLSLQEQPAGTTTSKEMQVSKNDNQHYEPVYRGQGDKSLEW